MRRTEAPGIFTTTACAVSEDNAGITSTLSSRQPSIKPVTTKLES